MTLQNHWDRISRIHRCRERHNKEWWLKSFAQPSNGIVRPSTIAPTVSLNDNPHMTRASWRVSPSAPIGWKFGRDRTPSTYLTPAPYSSGFRRLNWHAVRTVSSKGPRCGCSISSWRSWPPQLWTRGCYRYPSHVRTIRKGSSPLARKGLIISWKPIIFCRDFWDRCKHSMSNTAAHEQDAALVCQDTLVASAPLWPWVQRINTKWDFSSTTARVESE